MIKIIPKLNLALYHENDILYSQGDSADEIYFLLLGSVLLYVDITDHVDMSSIIPQQQSFNVPIAMYGSSSYFGDNDVLLSNNGYRSHTAICQDVIQLYTIRRELIFDCLKKFEKIKEIMLNIAHEKKIYLEGLNDDLVRKHRSKLSLKHLFDERGNG